MMPAAPGTKQEVAIRLVLSSLPHEKPEDKRLDIGLQDKEQQVHRGRVAPDGKHRFECRLEVRKDPKTGRAVFHGLFAQGTPAKRFLYLSWKRREGGEHPYLRRVKVPLQGLNWDDVNHAMAKGRVLEADITERKPHDVKPVKWVLGREK